MTSERDDSMTWNFIRMERTFEMGHIVNGKIARVWANKINDKYIKKKKRKKKHNRMETHPLRINSNANRTYSVLIVRWKWIVSNGVCFRKIKLELFVKGKKKKRYHTSTNVFPYVETTHSARQQAQKFYKLNGGTNHWQKSMGVGSKSNIEQKKKKTSWIDRGYQRSCNKFTPDITAPNCKIKRKAYTVLERRSRPLRNSNETLSIQSSSNLREPRETPSLAIIIRTVVQSRTTDKKEKEKKNKYFLAPMQNVYTDFFNTK